MAMLWHDAWHDAHDDLVDPAWQRHRNLENFRNRIGVHVPTATVAELDRTIVGYTSLDGEELSQFFLAKSARGTGIAGILMKDAEQRLRDHGVDRAFLLCAKGNQRAFHFYEKMGWKETAGDFQSLELNGKEYRVPVHRMEKDLAETSEGLGP